MQERSGWQQGADTSSLPLPRPCAASWIENARRKKRRRHGGGRRRVELEGQDIAVERLPEELLAIDEALTNLAAEDAEAAQVVKLRFYAGLSIEEAADALGISRAGAYRHWTYARAWLRSALAGESTDAS